MTKTTTTVEKTQHDKKAHATAHTEKQKKQQHDKKIAVAAHAEEQEKQRQEKKAAATVQADEKAQRREQAKQEAKLMLKVEKVKQDVQKAEQKLAKAQTKLADAHTHQHELEDKLAKLRGTQEEVSHNGVPTASDERLTPLPAAQETPLTLETPFITQSVDVVGTTDSTNATEATPILEAYDAAHHPMDDVATDQPPAEGHADSTETAPQDEEAKQESSVPAPLLADNIEASAQSDDNEPETATHETNEAEDDEHKSTATHRRTRRTHTEQ